MKVLAIIPARYGSSRLEGKPLADILGKPMIQWVYEQAQKSISDVYVATDDIRIESAVNHFDGKVVMTSENHVNGTTRCLEAAEKIMKLTQQKFDVVINVQGDEPMLDPSELTELVKPFESKGAKMSTLVIPITNEADLFSENVVYVTFDKNGKALYFSRSVIPFIRGVDKKEWFKKNTFYKHLGLYGYTYSALKEFASLPASNLENMELLEQNRWLENGNEIYVGITNHESVSVDTQEDLERVRVLLKGNK
ncbi:MAG: 3-deoxy-manno-octulosonate cytidylyltransferase [Salibacteraceae bacterium]